MKLKVIEVVLLETRTVLDPDTKYLSLVMMTGSMVTVLLISMLSVTEKPIRMLAVIIVPFLLYVRVVKGGASDGIPSTMLVLMVTEVVAALAGQGRMSSTFRNRSAKVNALVDIVI